MFHIRYAYRYTDLRADSQSLYGNSLIDSEILHFFDLITRRAFRKEEVGSLSLAAHRTATSLLEYPTKGLFGVGLSVYEHVSHRHVVCFHPGNERVVKALLGANNLNHVRMSKEDIRQLMYRVTHHGILLTKGFIQVETSTKPKASDIRSRAKIALKVHNYRGDGV